MSCFDLLARRKTFGDKLVIFKFLLFRFYAIYFSVEVGSDLELNHLKQKMDVKYEISGRNAMVSHH